MRISSFVLWIVILLLFLMLLFASIYDVYQVISNSFKRYYWFIGGFILTLVAERFISNKMFLKIYHHESTHMFMNLITFRKILMLQVHTEGGVVSSIGRNWMLEAVSLAPYCFPLASYIVMAFGYFFANDMVHILNLFLGMTYAFHILCIKEDLGPFPILGRHQTDINQYPLLFSYLYILTFWLFNTMIVLLSVRRDIVASFYFMFNHFRETITSVFS